MVVYIYLITLLVIIIYFWLEEILYSRKCNVPGPYPLPIVGNRLLFFGDSQNVLKVITNLCKEYSGAVRVCAVSRKSVFFSHPKYIENIISNSELISKGDSYRYLHPWLGQGLLTASAASELLSDSKIRVKEFWLRGWVTKETLINCRHYAGDDERSFENMGKRWKTHLKFLTPAFHYNILQSFLPVFLKNQKILINKLYEVADERPINLFPIMALAALDNITESIMGVSIQAQKNSDSEYVKSIAEITEIIALRSRTFFLATDFVFNLTPYRVKQNKVLKYLHEFSNKVIHDRSEELINSNITEVDFDKEFGMKNKHAFLDLLLLAKIDDEKLDKTSVREEVDTFMFEGHDTVTGALAFSLYCISKHKEVQDKIVDEQREIFGKNILADPTSSNLQQMKYLDLVIKESMRLYPPVPVIQRLITKDINSKEYHIPKDTSVLINIFGMQRNPDVFEDPLEFKPERFETPNKWSPFNWIPFSAGPRNCIGQKYAMMELKVVLSSILRHFEVLSSGIEPELCIRIVLKSKNGVYVKLRPRVFIE